jgi:hypothetical protein
LETLKNSGQEKRRSEIEGCHVAFSKGESASFDLFQIVYQKEIIWPLYAHLLVFRILTF